MNYDSARMKHRGNTSRHLYRQCPRAQVAKSNEQTELYETKKLINSQITNYLLK